MEGTMPKTILLPCLIERMRAFPGRNGHRGDLSALGRAVQIGHRRLVASLAIALLAVVVTACTSNVALKPNISAPPDMALVDRSVGFHLSDSFKTDTRETELYGNFLLGEASAAAFRDLFPQLFTRAIEVSARPPLGEEVSSLDAVIEPQIDRFDFWGLQIGGYQYWAELRYRFNLYAPDGGLITSWTAHGSGDGVVVANTADQAIEQAAGRFARSFDEVPEVKRWLEGRPIAGATAPAASQRTEPTKPAGMATRSGIYDGIVRVEVEPEPQAWRDFIAGLEDVPSGPGLTPLGLRIENTGTGRLLVRPSDITLTSDAGDTVPALPDTAVAAVLTERHARIASPPAGVGVMALPLLFVALVNAASAADEQAEFEARSAALVDQHLRETNVAPGGAVEGLLYFPPTTAHPNLRGLAIEIPLVDVDGATRYVVRLPAGEPEGEFRPFTREAGPSEPAPEE
jgi:hypothetical protein